MHNIAFLKEQVLCGVIRYQTYLESMKIENPPQKYQHMKSILVFVFPYDQQLPNTDEFYTARFAGGKDYHVVVEERIQELIQPLQLKKDYKIMVDVSFLKEKVCAMLAGLGEIGKNTLLLTKPYGSYCVIGEVLTEEEFEEYDQPISYRFCESCNRCQKACPNHALDQEGALEHKRCLSYLTQSKSRPSYEQYDAIKKMIYGCDICQEVCPVNRAIHPMVMSELMVQEQSVLSLNQLLNMTEAEYNLFAKDKAFHWSGYHKMLRNAMVASANKGNLSIEQINHFIKQFQEIDWLVNHLYYLKDKKIQEV